MLIGLKGGMDDEALLKEGIRKKRTQKARLTKLRNNVVDNLGARDIIDRRKTYEEEYEKITENLSELQELSDKLGEKERSKELELDLATMESAFEEVERLCNKKVKEVVRNTNDDEDDEEFGGRRLEALKKIEIPIFYGNVREYSKWKAAFDACVGFAKGRKEEKILHLRQYLKGEPLRIIDDLGYSAVAYDAALEKLERRYGGEERGYMQVMEKVEKFKMSRGGLYEIEEFAELLDTVMIKFKEMKKDGELGNGFLYQSVVKKLTESLAERWTRYRDDKAVEKGLHGLLEWIEREARLLRETKQECRGLDSGFKDVSQAFNNETHRWQGNRSDERQINSNYKRSYVTKTMNVKRPESRNFQNENYGRNRPRLICLHCKEEHFLSQCQDFRIMEVGRRIELVNELKLCGNCLGDNHNAEQCQKGKFCHVPGCTIKHSYWIHEFKRKEPNDQETDKTILTVKNNNGVNQRRWMSLRTIPIVLSNGAKRITVNALLDDASTVSYVSEVVLLELGLKGTQKRTPVMVIGGKTDRITTKHVEMNLGDLGNTLSRVFKALALKTVVGDMRVIDWSDQGRRWSHLRKVDFPVLTETQNVDVLIGADYLDLQISLEEVRGKVGEPIARLTPLGWTCVGGPMGRSYKHQTNFIRTFLTRSEELDVSLRRMWEIEELDTEKTMMCKTDEEIYRTTKETMRSIDGKIEVGLPWKKEKVDLQLNTVVADKRLKLLVQRLSKDEKLRKEYSEVIKNHEQKGYIEKVGERDQKETRWLLPHFPVIKRDRQTTKIRIVFDAAAKYQDVCLNDLIETGPKLQNDLFEILLRFRRSRIAVVCDISEMFLQIRMKKEDKRYLRFLWMENQEKIVYQFNRLVFGLNVSPFIAQLVSRENALALSDGFPRATDTILKSTYMDDSLDSVDTVEEAKKLKDDLVKVWKRIGMDARKWMSNSSELLEEIPEEERAKTLNLQEESMLTIKTLGLKWCTEEDQFQFDVEKFEEGKITKRNLLSWIARIFDPLGFLCAYVVRGKIFMQSVWMTGADWDDRLELKLEIEIRKWMEEAVKISEVRIPRCLQGRRGSDTTFHVFSDASAVAFGAVVYIREVRKGVVETNFIAAKSKVAPIKTVSIPRLELLGACVGVKLMKKITQGLEIKVEEIIYWSDSKDVLYWIKQQSRLYKPFVANRVSSIQELTLPKQWRYVPTKLNPADLLSRGISARECVESKLWWQGPEFLRMERNDWPRIEVELEDHGKERRKQTTLLTNVVNVKWKVSCLDPETYSSWKRLKRVWAWMRRFVKNCRKGKLVGELKVEEIKEAERMIIKREQERSFEKDLKELRKKGSVLEKSSLAGLNPIIGDDGLLRSNSRIINAEFLPKETRYPIILANGSWLTHLIIGDLHRELNHCAGTNQLLSRLGQKYWILCGRQATRHYETQCLECRRRKAKGITQIMAPLPSFRFEEPLEVFGRTAMDFAGPFETIQGRGKARTKRYMCLFTCMQTRAIHLEMVYGLDTEAFLRAFYRFVHRRGKPKMLLSDNGTNFVGATKELTDVVIDTYKVEKVLAKEEIRWIFNPPSSPHFGGIFEAMIKVAKKALRIIAGHAEMNDEELLTLMIKIESIVNSRPLTVIDADAKSLLPLTPDHFLKARWIERKPSELRIEESGALQKRWRRILELQKHFWTRWTSELVPTWSKRNKWSRNERNIEVGEIVWIMDRQNPVGEWPLAKVNKVSLGTDQKTRVVELVCEGKLITKPISRIFPLEILDEDKEKRLTNVENSKAFDPGGVHLELAD